MLNDLTALKSAFVKSLPKTETFVNLLAAKEAECSWLKLMSL